MRLKPIIVGMTVLVLGMGTQAFAANDYYPPERISCNMTNTGKLNCDGIDHHYLVEDGTTADFPLGKDQTFHFISGAAYFSGGMEEVTVIYTYNDHNYRTVKLRNALLSIRPNLTVGAWKKVNSYGYVCDAGYMSCPITNLPVISK